MDLQELIAVKKSYIESLEHTIETIRHIKGELDEIIKNTSISRTVGSSVSILGWFLTLIPPLTPVGIGITAAGAATAAGASIAQAVIDSQKAKEVANAIDAQFQAADSYVAVACKKLQEVYSTISRAREVGAKVRGAMEVRDTISGFELVRLVNPTATESFRFVSLRALIAAEGKMGAFKVLGLGVLGAGMAVWDIVSAWKCENATSEKMGVLIDEISKALDKENAEFRVLLDLAGTRVFPCMKICF